MKVLKKINRFIILLKEMYQALISKIKAVFIVFSCSKDTFYVYPDHFVVKTKQATLNYCSFWKREFG